MSDFIETAPADSSPADSSGTPAGAQNTGQVAEDNVPFHKHPRWQERTVEIQTLRAQNQQLNARLQQLEARREQTGGTPSQEEQQLRQQRIEAQRALKDLAPGIDELPQIKQMLTQQMQMQAQANDTRARGHIADLVKNAGIDAKLLPSITRYVALEASQNQNGDARYNAGDFAVLTEAFDAIKDQFVSSQQRDRLTALAASKTALSRLPGRPVGGVPGGVAFTKPVAGDQASQRTAMRERHNAAGAMIDGLTG